MKAFGAGKKLSVVGLDIGSRLVKALEVSFAGEKPLITKIHALEIDFPPGIKAAEAALTALSEKLNASSREVNTSLAAPDAIVRFVKMPRMKKGDLISSLKFEAEKYIPFNINEVITDACILEDDSGGQKEMRVVIAAAKKVAVNARLSKLKNAGFSVAFVDIDSFACFNAFCNAVELKEPSADIALINLGYVQTNVIICRGKNPYFTRDIQIGARDVAGSISQRLNLDPKKADAFLKEPKAVSPEIIEPSKQVLNNLADELRLSFGYYENQYGSSVREIYLSGGMARSENLVNFISESFGIKPVVWNPLAKFGTAEGVDPNEAGKLAPQFAVCAGLVLRK